MTISEKRIPELDDLRGIAILLVLFWHFTGMLVDPNHGAVQYLAWRYLIFGQSGVDLFFVLSGFLIIGILVDNRESQNYFSTFYARRALRILPPYLILVATFWIFTAIFGSTSHIGQQMPPWALLTFTQNWVMAYIQGYGPAGVGATWSLAVEEQFYLVAPVLILILPRRLLPKALILLCVVSAGARGIWFYTHPENLYAPDVATPLRLDGLCIGGLIALARRSTRAWNTISFMRLPLFGSMLGLLAIAPIYTWFLRSSIGTDVLYYFGHAYLAVLYGTVLLNILLWSGSKATSFLRSKALTYVGLISYSLYLFHTPFKGVWFSGHAPQLYSSRDVLLLTAAIISTFVFCALLYRFVERPAQTLGKRFRYKEQPLRSAIVPIPVT
jgi:peptidoglycan/LPS O-acetylase OafA/YrhL